MGPNVSSIWGNELVKDDCSPLFGLSAGLTLDYTKHKKPGLRSGVYFERKGSTIRVELMDRSGHVAGTTESKTTFDYISIPIHVQVHFGGRVQMFVSGGGYLAYLYQAKQYTNTMPYYPAITSYITEYYLPIDWGISLAIGATWPLSPAYSLSFECRDNLGLRNISKLPVSKNQVVRTNMFNLGVGLHYLLRMRPKTRKNNNM